MEEQATYLYAQIQKCLLGEDTLRPSELRSDVARGYRIRPTPGRDRGEPEEASKITQHPQTH